MTESEYAQVVAIIDSELGGIETDVRGRCKWTEICNAQTHIEGQLRAITSFTAGMRAAAERVIWFDWSGNDPDAVAAIDELRRVLASNT